MVDDVDLKIISVLQKEGLLTSSMLGKKLNLAESTVRRRIRQLIKQNVIRMGYHVNPIKVGLKVIVFIALDVALDKLDEVASSVAAQSEVRYVALTAGRYNVVILALFGNTRGLSQFLKLSLGTMPGIRGCEVLLNIDVKKAGLFLGFQDLTKT